MLATDNPNLTSAEILAWRLKNLVVTAQIQRDWRRATDDKEMVSYWTGVINTLGDVLEMLPVVPAGPDR